MLRTITGLMVLLLLGIFVNAQQIVSDPNESLLVKRKAEEGTFQIIQLTKIKEAIHEDLLVTIESKRKEDEVVYFDLSPNTRVMVLSRKEITSPGFRPLEDLYLEN